ncbi:MAG TPA: glycoside hydrolase family 15 protein [Solirubrobacteraceae bacterium]|jgi:GH15 family glucan-1,4-alpha-glucosidase|nr:glycoside hydrolase family 15 protein [Solirubrobacteraceae bacterium]
MKAPEQPPLGDYSLIGDCHGAALISTEASIDWCCLPRVDSASCFARLLDHERGGHCSVTLSNGIVEAESRYVEDTMVLETTLTGEDATVRVLDCMAIREQSERSSRREILRVIECSRGVAEVQLQIAPRFDYGEVTPWLRRAAGDTFTATGGDDGLVIWSDGQLACDGDELTASAVLNDGERLRLLIRHARPHLLKQEQGGLQSKRVDARMAETARWWRAWRKRLSGAGSEHPAAVRSALLLKALTYAPTGAIVAAPTTSLPETPAGERNWDYRFSWVRDSSLAARSLAELGCEHEAERFGRFIVRSAAGRAEDLQIVFGVGGERRISEQELGLSGYRGARPVRVGNEAAGQLQLDAFGEMLNQAWRWHRRGHSPDDDEWRFLAELVETAAERWVEPDRGIWEWRNGPRHFVHSKAACWTALERGLTLAEECMRRAPLRRWKRAREEIRQAIETRGYDEDRGVFVQCFDEPELDAALLLLPVLGFLEFDDERMIRTADALREALSAGGFMRRYERDDGLPGKEGAFLACSFWLVECYARQGRVEQARVIFDHVLGAASPRGVFSEQIDPGSRELLGNYPQALTHLSHIAAAIALEQGAGHQVGAS